MSVYAYPALYCLFVWWFSTGLIVFLDNLPRSTFRWSLIGGSAVAALALVRLHASAQDPTVAGAYAAFTYGVLVWGWHEMAFFMGLLSGPLKTACPREARGWARFRAGVAACLWHELGIIFCAAIVVWMNAGAPNQVGTYTFLALWGMRTSAKLNVFLGVRNLGESFLPEHLHYLLSFMARRPINALFPFSVTAGTVIVVAMLRHLAAPGVTPFQAAGLTFLVTMVGLAVLEHWVLILPLPFERIWGWWLRHTRTPARTIALPGQPARAAGPRPLAAAPMGVLESA